MQFIAFGPACFIANKPRSMARVTPVERKPLNLLSKNGIRMPLRAHAWRDLNREFWSQGKLAFPDVETTEPRELTAFEKTIDPSRCDIPTLLGMTAEQYASASAKDLRAATERMEPLPESRRAWLTQGVFHSHIHGVGGGALSLEGLAYREGSIGETLAAKGIEEIPVADSDIVDSVADVLDDEHDAVRYGTPYVPMAPALAKQIAAEMRKHGNGEVIRVAPGRNEKTGALTVRTSRTLLGDAFQRLAKSVVRTWAESYGRDALKTYDDLLARIDLVREAVADRGPVRDFSSPDPDEERRRFLDPADDLWHSSFERVHAMVEVAVDTESERPCQRRGCTYFEVHRHIRVPQRLHRRPQGVGSKDEFWRRGIFDVTAFELGTHGLVDPLVDQAIAF